MTPFVVDTNVAIVANGRETDADEQCQLSCIRRLRSLAAGEVVAIDNLDLILAEYKRRLHFSGLPGVGDAFFKHVFNNQYREEHVRRVVITRSDDARRGFEELPKNAFDPSDRKFLAVSVVAGAVVLNANDSDWAEQDPLMGRLGVEVRQLCPRYASKTARRGR